MPREKMIDWLVAHFPRYYRADLERMNDTDLIHLYEHVRAKIPQPSKQRVEIDDVSDGTL